MSHVTRKPGRDQLCSNCKADQRHCFRYSDSTILIQFVTLCQAWSDITKPGFLTCCCGSNVLVLYGYHSVMLLTEKNLYTVYRTVTGVPNIKLIKL